MLGGERSPAASPSSSWRPGHERSRAAPVGVAGGAARRGVRSAGRVPATVGCLLRARGRGRRRATGVPTLDVRAPDPSGSTACHRCASERRGRGGRRRAGRDRARSVRPGWQMAARARDPEESRAAGAGWADMAARHERPGDGAEDPPPFEPVVGGTATRAVPRDPAARGPVRRTTTRLPSDEAVDRIRRGELRKVVLARTIEVTAEREFDPRLLAHRLRAVDPDAYTFAAPTDDGVLVGASPELLVSRRGHEVRSNPLAGSAPRSGDPEEDRANADALIASSKDREEHAIVVDAVAETLRPFCEELTWDDEPVLRETPNVWHLSTRFRGVLREPAPTALDLVAELHPTPAVAGTPRDAALDTIAELEPFDRGGTRAPSAGSTPRETVSGRSRCAARSSAAIARSCMPAPASWPTRIPRASSTRPSGSSDRSSTRCAGASARGVGPVPGRSRAARRVE